MSITPSAQDACKLSVSFVDTARKPQRHSLDVVVRKGTLAAADGQQHWAFKNGRWVYGELPAEVKEVKTDKSVAEIGSEFTGCSGDKGYYTDLAYSAIVSDGHQFAIVDAGGCRDADPGGLELLVESLSFVTE